MTQELTLGEFYKETRERLGYTQRDAATVYCNHSLISRFENNQTILRADKLLIAINGLDMTPTEFFALHANYQPNRLQTFNQKMSNYIISGNIEGLKKMVKPKPSKRQDKIFNILVKCAIFDLTDEMLITKSERRFINQYFWGINLWTTYEVSIFSQCLEVLDDSEVYDIGQDIFKSDEFSKIIDANLELVKKTLLNLYVHLICRGSYRHAEMLREKIDSLTTEWDMEEKIVLYLFEKFSLYKKEKSPELLQVIQDDIQNMNRYGATGMAKRIAMFIEKNN
jgi:Rgg/GadR/MutR family transcriptional activator